MWTVFVAVLGVFLILGLWTSVDLLTSKHLGERTHRCCCGRQPGKSPCGTCPGDAEECEWGGKE